MLCQLPEALLSRPALWLLGHTHGSRSFRLGPTRFRANSFGYLGLEALAGPSQPGRVGTSVAE